MDGIARIVGRITDAAASLGANGGILIIVAAFGIRAALGFRFGPALGIRAAAVRSSALIQFSNDVIMIGRRRVEATVTAIDQSTTLIIELAALGSPRVGSGVIVVLSAESDAETNGDGRDDCDGCDDLDNSFRHHFDLDFVLSCEWIKPCRFLL